MVEQLEFIVHHNKGESTTRSNMRSLSNRGFKKNFLENWSLLGDLEEGSRRQGFALDWMLSGSGSKFMSLCFSNSYLKGKRDEVGL